MTRTLFTLKQLEPNRVRMSENATRSTRKNVRVCASGEQSFGHLHHLLDQGRNLLLHDFGLTTQTQTNPESATRSSALVLSRTPNIFDDDEFSCVSSLEAHQSCSSNTRITMALLPCEMTMIFSALETT